MRKRFHALFIQMKFGGFADEYCHVNPNRTPNSYNGKQKKVSIPVTEFVKSVTKLFYLAYRLWHVADWFGGGKLGTCY